MKLFQLNRKYLAVMRIEPHQSCQERQPMIVLFMRFLISIPKVVFAILSAIFLGYEAKTLDEYANSFYGTVTMIGFPLIFAILLWKMDSLFKLIGDFEKLIETRKM